VTQLPSYHDLFAVAIPPGCGRDHTFARLAAVLRNGSRGEAVAAPKRSRKPSIATLVKRAEKTGKTVTSVTTADGTTINFGDTSESENALDQWIAKHARAPERH
jgi:hypothetical protein